MHVEVNVALNFIVSYLYNKLPRRRVDLFAEELEKGLKQKFEGHWYPDKPFKGSGFRCVRCNGEKVDPVIMKASQSAGLDLQEVMTYMPEELTLWIDPSEVSYRLNEKSPIKVLHTDRGEEDGCDTMDQEVQVANHTFNPDASSFQPIDSLSSSLSNLSLSPSSPVPPGTWSNPMSPSSSLFSTPPQPSMMPAPLPAPPTHQQAATSMFMGKTSSVPQFTAASFAATKFGSTKLKSQAKRPTRLSPIELGNYFRQQQRAAFNNVVPSPQRPRSLSPRDPRLEFIMDQQQRFYAQLSPQGHQSLAHTLQQQQQQQHLAFPTSATTPLSPNSSLPGDFMRHTSSPHYSHLGMTAFPEMLSPGSHSPGSQSALQSPVNSLSPEGYKTFLDDLQQLGNMHGYPAHLQHLLVAN